MEFEAWTAEHYRGLSLDELQERRQYVLDLMHSEDCTVTVEQLRSEIDLIRAEYELRNEEAQLRSLDIATVASGSFEPLARSRREVHEDNQDMYATQEYERAFMEFICRGAEIPMEYRADATTGTADSGAVIPTTLLNRIIEEMDTYGNIYAGVTKMNIQGGVEIPTAELKPVAKWVDETKVSDTQKLEANDKISFSYYMVECRLSQRLLANIVSLPIFNAKFVPLAAEAIVRALEAAIVSGSGSGQPLGITKDARVPAANVIEMTEAELSDWEAWHKKVKAKMKKAYRNGNFIMAQSSFDGYIDGMVDKNGQPVGRVNYGINGEENYRFMGKSIETVEEDIIADFATAAAGDVVAIFTKLSDYAINSNYQMTSVKWQDHDNNLIKNKCTMVVDGKLVDPYGTLIIKKKASA